jgi:hypothetical protein
MDVRKWLQIEEDVQEKEMMTESGEYDWDNNLDVGLDVELDIDLDIDLDSDSVVDLENVLESSGQLQKEQHLCV